MTPHQLLQTLSGDTSKCPRCGVDNKCSVAHGKSGNTCWCFSESVSEEITDSVTNCYCKKCLKEVNNV